MAVIGVLGSYGGLNLGDEAILTAILASLRRNRPGDELVVFSRDAEHTRAHHDADRVVAARDVSRDQILPEIARLDLLLGGGGLLYDGEARAYLRDVRLAQERGIPTFAYAVGAGPLEAPEDRQQVLESLERMAGITVRDELSQRVLEDVGVERPIEVTADPALLLEPEPFTDEMLAREGVEHARHMVGVSVREPGKAAPDLDEAGYHQLLAHAADFIVHRYDADLMFVPMERDDIRHSHAVVGHMLAADRAHILKGSYTPRQILGLMAHVDAVLGMRLHVLIFAAVAGVPFLPLPYAGKVSDFVAALGLHVPGPASRESTGPLLAAFDRMWDARGAEGQRLRNRVPSLQERARRTCPLAVAVLEQGR